jgi:hypothetical protein
MQVVRNDSDLVTLGLAFGGAMAGGVDAPSRLLPNVRQQTDGTQGSGKLTSAPASTPTSTPTIHRVRYTARGSSSDRE